MARAVELGLPGYMGFGRLDHGSIRMEGECLIGNYLAGEDLVYEVTAGGDQAAIVEFYDGTIIGRTDDTSVDEALMQHFGDARPYAHPRFEDLFYRVTRGRNIQLKFAGPSRIAYHPAGSLFTLDQPILPDRRRAADDLSRMITDRGAAAPLREYARYKGYLFRTTADLDIEIEEIEVQRYLTLLVDLPDAADLLWNSGIVPPTKEWRLEIAEVPFAISGEMTVLLTGQGNEFLTYAILVDDGSREVNFENTANYFRLASEHLLAEVQYGRIDEEEEGEQEFGTVPEDELDLEEWDLCEAIMTFGSCELTHYWDTGGMAGGGVSSIYEYQGKYYPIVDGIVLGPYPTLDDAIDQSNMLDVNSATKGLLSSAFPTDELARRCVADQAGIEARINGRRYAANTSGDLRCVDGDEEDED